MKLMNSYMSIYKCNTHYSLFFNNDYQSKEHKRSYIQRGAIMAIMVW